MHYGLCTDQEDPGLSLGRCYTFGMLAAKHAMGK